MTLVEPARALVGHIGVPGDKSISHRAALLGAISDGETTIAGFGARPTPSRPSVRSAHSVPEVEEGGGRPRAVEGRGPARPARARRADRLRKLRHHLMRFCPASSWVRRGASSSTGDESLGTRPVERIAEPLRRMGADRRDRRRARAARRRGRRGELSGIDYELPVASAQVKSAVLLAGLYASGQTTGRRAGRRRATTRRSCSRRPACGVGGVHTRYRCARVERAPAVDESRFRATSPPLRPFVVAATLLPGSELIVHDVGLNPTRTGLLDVLARMGARITRPQPPSPRRRAGWRPRGARGGARRDGDRPRRGAEADRRAAARGAGRRVRARGDGDSRRRRATPEGNGPDRKCENFASSPWRAHLGTG